MKHDRYELLDSDRFKRVKLHKLNKETIRQSPKNVKHLKVNDKLITALRYVIAFALLAGAIFIAFKLTGGIEGKVSNISQPVEALAQEGEVVLVQEPIVEAPQTVSEPQAVVVATVASEPVIQAPVKSNVASKTGNYAKDFIYQHESNFRLDAVNSIGCIGIGQRCPQKGVNALEVACPDWRTNYECQDAHFTAYMLYRYGSWENAMSFWLANKWW